MKQSLLVNIINFLMLFGAVVMFPTVAFAVSVNFSWIPNSESNIAGYKIYYGTTTGGEYPNFVDINNNIPDPSDGRINGTVTGLTNGITYYFVCTAYNDLGIESSYSSEVEYTASEVGGTGVSVTKIFGGSTNSDYPGTLTDTFINVNQNNESSNSQLMAYTWPENTVANVIIIKADLTQLPANVQIQTATLELYLTNSGGDTGYDISVHKIINYNPVLTSTTGYTYDGSNGWTSNSCCYNNAPMAQSDIEAAEYTVTVDQVSGYKSWVVTEMVKNWISVPSTNFGLLLNSDIVATSESFRTFASSEEANSALRPRLTITYPSIAAPKIIRLQFN